MILRFGNSPPQTVEGKPWRLGGPPFFSIGYLVLPDDIGFKEKLLGVQRLVGQARTGFIPPPRADVTAVWDVRGLDAAFRFAISLFEAESAQESVNLRNPCGW